MAADSTRSAMPPKIALLACSVFEREIALLAGNAAHILETRFYEIALHDRPDTLREKLQGEILALDARDDIDAIVLAYGLCGLGTAGLRAGRHPVRAAARARLHHRVSRQQGTICRTPARLPDLLLLHARLEPGAARAGTGQDRRHAGGILRAIR
jgi:hypothetical protein